MAILVVAGAAAVVINNNNDNKDSKPLVDLNGWDDIVKDASGQTVNLGFYMTLDPAINQSFLPYMQKEMKDKYNITVTCDNTGYTGYGPVAAKVSVTEIENGKTTGGTYDLIWGDTSAYSAMTKNGAHYEYVYSKTDSAGKQWGQIIPNSYYLKSTSENTVRSQFSGYVSGTAVNFSNGQTMFIYNSDFNRSTITIGGEEAAVFCDMIVVYGENNTIKGIVKVVGDDDPKGETMTNVSQIQGLDSQTKNAFESAYLSCMNVYKIGSVRTVLTGACDGTGLAKGKIVYGLPTTFQDLAEWVKIYKGQFTYPSYNNSSATFHTNLLVQAAIYELTWNDDGTGWKTADNRDLNVQSVNEALKNVKTEAEFKSAFGYVFNYLNEIEPYLHQYGSTVYIDSGTITAYNSKMVGNGTSDTDYKDGTIMLALTTCTSIDARVDPGSGHCIVSQYGYNAGVFSMSTGCYSDYYMFIPSNSSHVSAAMVVANWLLDPETQFKFYTQTGNGFNIDTNKEMFGKDGKSLGFTVGQYFENDDHKLSSYTLSLSVDTLSKVTVASDFTPYSSIAAQAWTNYVYNSDAPVTRDN